jgi:PAS domain S-box-containing protein
MSTQNKKNSSDLRKKAEKKLELETIDIKKLSNDELRRLAYEFRVHQIELDLQNDELQQAQVELEYSRDKYSSLYDFAPVGYFTISDKGIFLEANLTCATMLGIERSSLINKPLSKFIKREDNNKYYRYILHVFEKHEHKTVELMVVKKDGTEFYAQLECVVTQDEDENPKTCRAILTDITESKQAEERLRDSERRSRAWLENSPVCTKIVDLDFNLQYMSSAGIKNLHVDDITPFYGKPYPFDFYPKSFRNVMSENMKRVVETGEIATQEAPVVDKYGNELWFHSTIVPVNNNEGLIDYLMIVSIETTERNKVESELKTINESLEQHVIDRTVELTKINEELQNEIAERKKIEETLIQSEKLKALGTITAGISHEFNNILNIISGNVQLLQMDYKDHSNLMDRLSIISKSIDNGASITDRMREFTHGETDTMDFVSADINKLLTQSVEFIMPRWRNMAQAGGINYNMDMEGTKKEVPSILCNPLEIKDVFINIISNALDAMPDGGRISFRTWSKGDTVFVSITDTGRGMSEDLKKNVFDPFFTTKRPEGTGLGMSTSYSKVARHGGKIEVDSEEGKGSTFTLQFPTTIETASPITTPKPELETKDKKLSILVVDDEEDICNMLDEFLTRSGHKVKAAYSGAGAIALVKRERFDLVLCDLAMPDVFGYDVIKFINKLEKRPKIGIITGWGGTLKPMNDEEFKVDFIIRKSFELLELTKHMNDVFGADS